MWHESTKKEIGRMKKLYTVINSSTTLINDDDDEFWMITSLTRQA